MKKFSAQLQFLLIVGLRSSSGCSMYGHGRRERSYEHYVRKSSQGRVKTTEARSPPKGNTMPVMHLSEPVGNDQRFRPGVGQQRQRTVALTPKAVGLVAEHRDRPAHLIDCHIGEGGTGDKCLFGPPVAFCPDFDRDLLHRSSADRSRPSRNRSHACPPHSNLAGGTNAPASTATVATRVFALFGAVCR